MFGFLRRRRRDRIRSRPFPDEWLRVIRRNVPMFGRLPEADRRELLGHVQVFVVEKNYEGCGGLELTEEIRVTIAAAACILLLHRRTDYFPGLITILVYPDAYVAPATTHIGGGILMEGDQIRLGEAWKGGVVVVSWRDLMETAAGRDDGRNLVLHEFAHLLDMEDGAVDGTPVLEGRGRYARWSSVMEHAFERLRRDRALGRYSVLDKYGATDPAEFFAVATEAFFEKAAPLRRRHPELYEELAAFYRQDPARWDRPASLVLVDPEGDEDEVPAVEGPS
ncbi:Protein MtfA [Aquisphaera giovannonii]|uniref:Protein MtfA n=1 Tax=Aquisphaera giovannonii TaxID=406548 RepID=A0A5B9W3D1_9BACT|nr:M90 family metallopeptidase [Aquisphaera giovannonii]QEH34767.1 Protein MtfA [Aquisphaera giovannonii]